MTDIHPVSPDKPHPALNYLQLERSSAILLDRPAHTFFHGLLYIYGAAGSVTFTRKVKTCLAC